MKREGSGRKRSFGSSVLSRAESRSSSIQSLGMKAGSGR